jgi:hypothetical protein
MSTKQPDIEPTRLSAVDIASLAPVEMCAILVRLAGSDNPEVTQALIDTTRRVLTRTRVDGIPAFLKGLDQ